MDMLPTKAAAAFQSARKTTDVYVLKWAAALTSIGLVLAVAALVVLIDHDDFLLSGPHGPFYRGGDQKLTDIQAEDTECAGRRVYIYDLPPEFNEGVLQRLCGTYSYPHEFCMNGGMGKRMEHVMEPMESWYISEQYLLEPMIHERFKQYRCLTNNPDRADLLYLPYYVAADYTAHTRTNMMQVRDLLSQRFVGWLMGQPTWKRNHGHKDFLVLGRMIYDFTRRIDVVGWGGSLLRNPELQNVTKVTLEKNPYSKDKTVVAIPFSTSFHPASDAEIELWSKTIVESKREKLVSFAGNPRNSTRIPRMRIRDVLFEQCDSSEECETLRCGIVDCRMNPQVLSQAFLTTQFCCQPPGDFATRKGTFDCLVAGGIPVFFTPDSAYRQYLWHLPVNWSSYSVFFDEVEFVNSNLNIIDVLSKIPESEILEKRAFIAKEVMPRIVYDIPGEGRSRDSKVKDAFDITLEHFFNPSFQTYS